MAATQDFLTAAYLLTRRDEFFTRSEFGQLCSFMGDASDRVDLPPPALIKPVEMWTGKQLFSVLIRPNVDVTLLVTMETKEKTGCTCKDKGEWRRCTPPLSRTQRQPAAGLREAPALSVAGVFFGHPC